MWLFKAPGRKRSYYRSHGVTIGDVAQGSWTKSTFSNMNGNCVEISRLTPGRIGVRDTKDNTSGPTLFFTGAEWDAFIAGAKQGEFDNL
ncbi:MAG: DUF397 domain-containing protein [Streptosporangiaceae bacterium]